MATFVQLEPDAFNSNFNNYQNAIRADIKESAAGQAIQKSTFHVRRPVRGIQIKNDTYATIRVLKSNGEAIKMFDAAATTKEAVGKGISNSNFILQSVTEQRAEKQQIVATFGSPYIFFFGEQPRIINVSGVLLNTEDFNWRAEWWENYDLYLRGTQCVRTRSRVYLSWDDIVVEGYIFQAGAADDASNRNVVQFNFQMFLTNYQNISNIGDPNAHWDSKSSINLDPNSVDVPGSRSNTQLVRAANVASEGLAAGHGAQSLFDYLRSGDLGAASTRLVELQGQVVDVLSLAGQFVSGRNIRVPIGFEGAAAFDSEVQLSLASLPDARSVITGDPASRVITLQTGGLNLVKEFRVALGAKYGPARVGLPLSDNEDEFVARSSVETSGTASFAALDPTQTASLDDGTQQVRDIFAMFGINTDPPSDLTLLFRRAGFGIVSLAAGMNLANSSTARSGLNAIGTVL